MNKIRLLILLSLSSVLLSGQSGYLNCSTIIVGKDASSTGFVTVAHNEDDGGNQIVNFYKVPYSDNKRESVVKFREGGVEPQIAHSLALLWFEMPGQSFADSFVNENGVLVTSNSCPSKERFGEIVDGGIGYELRRLIAERALSARIGVELAGQLIEKWGYNASGRSYTIADKNEAWVFAVVRGKNWVARRVPDDQVAFIPNYYTIGKVDLTDSDNFLASKDLVNHAIRRGWYDPAKDGDFNFTKVYSSENNLSDMDNIARMWVGVKMLSGKDYSIKDEFPFSFVPAKKISMKEIFPVLSNHFEGTELDDSKEYTKGSPHSNKVFSICSSTQQLSFIAELRSGLPWEIGGRVWVAPRRGCVNAYIPVYFGIKQFPESLFMDDPAKALDLHFKRDPSIYDRNNNMLWWSFVSLAEYADKDYGKRIAQIRKSKEDLQQQFMKMATQLEKDYLPIYKKDPAKAAAMLADFENSVFQKASSEAEKLTAKDGN
ncbi:MAG: C69 family dipeptidase [Bacteroidales bacterium]